MQTDRRGQVREIAGQPKAETHARTPRHITATGRRLPHQMAGVGTRMADPLTGIAPINLQHARVRRATRAHRPTTIAEEAALINRRHALARQATRTRRRTTIAEAAAPINRQPDRIPRRPAVTRPQRALILRRPTQRLRALTPLLATVMGAAEARVTVVEEVAAALTAEAAVVVDRVAEAVLTDAKISGKKPAPNRGGLFCV
jgi:hypothetical protein